MPRPNYNQEQLQELTSQYTESAIRYANQIVGQLNALDEDPDVQRDSEEYKARKMTLNSVLYQTLSFAREAYYRISAGYPPRFSARSMERLSNRLLEDPVYANVMSQVQYGDLDNELQQADVREQFVEDVSNRLPDSMGPTALAEDAMPRETRSSRAIVLRQVLNELDATGTGYYIPGWRRGSNSPEFENVKRELRRQIGMLEAGLPLSSNDDDRLIGLMNTYSNDKRSNRTRAFGNTRQRSMLKLYAELTRHPSPRAANAPAYYSADFISEQYNRAKGLNEEGNEGHPDYVDLNREEYEVHPERTVAQEYNDVVVRMRQMTNARRTSNLPLTDEERAAFLDLSLRAAALQTIIVRDPAGPNAALNPAEVEKLMDAGMSNEALAGSVEAAFRSWDHMQELTVAFEDNRPQLQQNGQYLADPGNYRNPLFRRLRVIAQPTVAERLLDAKNELRNLEFDGGPITMGQRNRLRVLAQRVLALQQAADASENGGIGVHLSDQEMNAKLSEITDTTDVQRAVDTCLRDPEKAQEYVETLTVDGYTFQDMKNASTRMARGGILDMIDHEEAVLTEMPEYEFNQLEQAAAEERIIRFAALNHLRDAHKNDPNPNAVVTDEEIREEMNRVRADERFMASVQGKLTSVDTFHTAATGMCSLRYARHYARALEYQQRIHDDPDAADMFEGYLMDEIASMIAIRNIQQEAGTPDVFITEAQMVAATQAAHLGDAYLALQRGVERDGYGIAEALLTNTFNKAGDEYQQAFAQNVVPMIRRYPYPPFQPGTIGAADEEISPRLTTNSNTTLAANREDRLELVNLMVRRLALRRMAMEDPEGGYARMTPQKRQTLARYEAEIRLDPRYRRHFREVIDSARMGLQTINQMNRAVSLPNLKARYNRALGGDFVDPLAAGFIKLTPEEWILRETEKLEEAAAQPNKQWTEPEKESLIRSYARMHLMQEQQIRNPERGADTVTQRQIDEMIPEFLGRPGMREKLNNAFARPARALSNTIAAHKQQTMANAQLSDADKLARMMAIGKLEAALFDTAIVTPAEIAAAEQEVRRSASYQRLAEHLNAGNALDTIAPQEGENYYTAMQDKAFKLPGTAQTYDARNHLLAQELRSLKQQGRLDEAGNVAAQIYILAQYEHDGVPYEDLPDQAELMRMADSLCKTADFKDALTAMKAAPNTFDDLANGAEGIGVKMRSDDMTFRLNAYALQGRLTNDPDDWREPNLLHELRAGVMTNAAAKLLQGNAEAAWVSDEEKNARRDEYIRFTALNRLMTQRPGTAYIPEADVQAEIQKLQQDAVFMQRLESRLDSPTLLRNSVFNSAGVQRWSDTGRMDEFHDMLKAASKAEKEGREGFGHVYGAASEYLAGTIDTRLSGREEDNVSLATRDLNASVNSVLYSDRFRVLENAIRTNPSEFGRIAGLFKLPAADFKEQYEKLTDEYAQRYPNAPSKDPSSISAYYEKALADIKTAAQEGPEAIAADEAKRQALAKNIREVFLDRRVLLKSKKDPQLMRRDLSGDSTKTSGKVAAAEAQESEAVDRMLGDLNEKLKDPQAVQGYLELMNGAEDLRILAAADHHAKEPFKDPLLVQLEEKGLAAPAIDRQAQQAALIARINTFVPNETQQQKEARLQDQIAQLIVDKMYEGIPDDELPNTAGMEARRNAVKSDPYFQTAVARLASSPVELNNFLEDVPNYSLREVASALDTQYKAQMLAADPQSEPFCNLFYLWSAQAIREYEDGVSLSTTGQDLNEWSKGRKETAMDFFVGFTAYHRLLQENPQRVQFSQAEVDAKIKEVEADEQFMGTLASQQKNAAEMRKYMFNYPGIVLYKMRDDPESYVATALRGKGYSDSLMPGCLDHMAESLMFRLKNPDAVKKNYMVPNAENRALVEEFKKSAEYQLLHRAFREHPRWANRFLFEVLAAKPDEVKECYDSYLADVREAYGIEAPQEQEEEEIGFNINGENVDVQAGVEAIDEQLRNQERELNGENDLEADPLQDVNLDENAIYEGQKPEAVGWASLDRKIEDLVFTGDPNSYFNQQRAAMHSILKAPAVYPETLTACLENMYMAAILKEAGKEITEEAVDENRHALKNDALFQKFRSKCLADHKFAEEQLKKFTEPDVRTMYRAQFELSPDPYERLKEQIRWDLTHNNTDADFEKNFRKLYAMTKFGPQERPKAAEIDQKAETLKNDPALNKALLRLKTQGQNGQTNLNSGYGLMLVDGVFAYNKEATVNTRLGGITGPTFKQSSELKYHAQYDPKPSRILAPGTDVAPKSPAAEFRNNAAKLDEAMQTRQRTAAAGGNAAMSNEELQTFAVQTCKTVALYNLSQSPQYKGKQVDKDALKAEMLRLKDDPEMKSAIRVAADNPQAHKALVEGMMRTHEDPAAFTAYVRGFGQDWQEGKAWLENTYTQPMERFASRTYKPEPKFAGIPQLSGVTVRTDAFTKDDAADGSQLSDKFTQLKDEAAAELNAFIIKRADDRKADGPKLQKKMAKVYAVKQIRASQADPHAEVKDLDEKIERRAEKLLEDPAFKTAMTSLVKAPNKKVSEKIVSPILAEKSYTASADQLQEVIDERHCLKHDLDPLTGKKLPEEHEIQAEGQGPAIHH